MAAVSPSPELRSEPLELSVVAGETLDADTEQRRVESQVARAALLGAVVGAFAGAGAWMVIVVLALAGKGWALGPMLAVGAACGVFAGIFLGGWAGTVVGALRLERYEHEHLPGR
jgi:hypothetical protein